MKIGWELPNVSSGLLTGEEWQRYEAIAPKVVKVRGYHLRKETLDMLAITKPVVILRPIGDGDFDVGERVNELRSGIVELMQWGFPLIVVICDNEPNLGSKPVPDRYWNRVAEVISHPSLKDFWGERVRVATPPLAVMQGEEDWYAAAGADFLQAFDYISFHGYGQTDNSLLIRSIGLAKQFGIPLLMDECGDSHETASYELKAVSVSSYLRIAADAGVELATMFICGSNGDWNGFVPPVDVVCRCLAPVIEVIHAAP